MNGANDTYDIRVDFNDIWVDSAHPGISEAYDYDSVEPHVDATAYIDAYVDHDEPLAAKLAPGRELTVGDGEGNLCPAVVTEVAATRVVLKLDLDKFQAATVPPAERTPE